MLIPVNYHKRHYPPHIRPHIFELAGHFDIESISPEVHFHSIQNTLTGKENSLTN